MILNGHTILNYVMPVSAKNCTAWSQNNYCIYSNARLGFFLIFDTTICEAVLNLCMHAEADRTKPNHSELDHAESNLRLHRKIIK